MSDERVENKAEIEEFEGHRLEENRVESDPEQVDLGRVETRYEGKVEDDDFEGHKFEVGRVEKAEDV